MTRGGAAKKFFELYSRLRARTLRGCFDKSAAVPSLGTAPPLSSLFLLGEIRSPRLAGGQAARLLADRREKVSLPPFHSTNSIV